MQKPFISVITVVFNSASTLEKTIESVLGQDFNNFEYIIIDGGSTDGTVEIIKKNESKLAFWISENDDGVYDAMNKAIGLAKGEWLYFLGADDVLLNVLERTATYLKNENSIYYGDVYRPCAKRRYDGEFSALKLSFRNICHQSIFYHKNVFKKYRYNLKYQVFADYELNVQCFSDPKVSFCYIPEVIAIFNDENGLSKEKEDVAFRNDKSLLIKDNFPYYIYLIACCRQFIISTLIFLNIDKLALSIQQVCLRLMQKLTLLSFKREK